MGATSTLGAQSHAALYPTLHFLVQISGKAGSSSSLTDPDPRITVASRVQGSRQTITDAAVYILHLPSASALSSSASVLASALLCELQVNLGALHASRGVLLIITARLLPKPGSIADPDIEAMARSRDLSLRQLTNKGEIEMEELLGMIDTVRDSVGKLAVTSKLRYRDDIVVALVVEYQLYADCDL